jgi:hypothetical protein
MAPSNGEKDPGTNFLKPEPNGPRDTDLESSYEIHCDHQQRARDEHFNAFHDRILSVPRLSGDVGNWKVFTTLITIRSIDGQKSKQILLGTI